MDSHDFDGVDFDDFDGVDDLDLLHDVREALRESHPLPLLSWASALLAAVDPGQDDLFDVGSAIPVSREDLLTSFIEVRLPETTALLNALAALSDDEVEQRRIRREMAGRRGKPPRWLRRLEPIGVTRAVQMSHVLGDGDNVMLDVVTGNGDTMTVIAYIDHNMGTAVKDAFVVDEPLAVLQAEYEELVADEPDTTFTELDPADARARMNEAIDQAAMIYPPLETETWPACRPLVEWVVRHLPAGGTGYVRPEWSDDDRDALVERFLASAHAPDVPSEDAADLADVLVWFACDYGPGDPLRWSPVSVEIFLTGFLPGTAMLSPETLRHGPEVLAAFVRFAHQERDVRRELTADTLAAVEQCTPQFLAEIEHSEYGGGVGGLGLDRRVLELLLGADDGEGPPAALVDLLGGRARYEAMLRATLVDQVGSEQVLADLDTAALPDEPLDLSTVPEDVRERVAKTAALTDAYCEELLDIEHRTACRRLLADAAAGDSEIFRRRSSDDRAAAAVAWVIAKANDTLQPYNGGLTATDLVGSFGVSGSVSQRAAPMLEAVQAPSTHASNIRLGSPRYLVATTRARIIALRDAR